MTIPVTVLGGYLGAGKTTIVNRLLTAAGTQGLRLGVLINDFGSINLDAALIASRSDSVIELSNGCICCSLSDGFASALLDLAQRARTSPTTAPEHLVIETSGVALPRAVAQYAHMRGFTLDSVVVAADAEQVLTQCSQRYVGETVINQLVSADMILLTKCDLVEPSVLQQTRGSLAQISEAPVVEIRDGRVELDLLIGSGRSTSTPVLPLQTNVETPPHKQTTNGFQSLVIDIPKGLGKSDLYAWLESAPEEILRAKGVAAAKDGLVLLDRVGHRVQLRPLSTDSSSTNSTNPAISKDVIGKLIVLGLAPLVLDWP